MPILFQPPDPVAPGISSAYGAAQQWTADAGNIVRAYAEAAQAQRAQQGLGAQAQLAQAQHLGQIGSQQYQAQFQADQQQQQLQMQGEIAQAQLMPSQAAQQKAALAAWLNEQELTQADRMQTQQMQQQVSYINNSDQYTPQEKMDLITQLRTKIDPNRQRMQAEQAKQLQMQTQNEMHLNSMQQAMANGDAGGVAAGLDRFYKELPNGHGAILIDPMTRKMIHIAPPKEAKDTSERDEAKKAEREEKADEQARKDYREREKAAHDEILKESQVTDVDPADTTKKKLRWPEKSMYFEQHVAARMRDKGLGGDAQSVDRGERPTEDDYVKRRREARQGTPATPTPAPAPTPAAGTPSAGSKPFDPKVLSSMKESDRDAVMGAQRKAAELADDPAYKPETKIAAQGIINRGIDLVAKAGGMGPLRDDPKNRAAWEEYRALTSNLNLLLKDKKPAPEGSAPFGGFAMPAGTFSPSINSNSNWRR